MNVTDRVGSAIFRGMYLEVFSAAYDFTDEALLVFPEALLVFPEALLVFPTAEVARVAVGLVEVTSMEALTVEVSLAVVDLAEASSSARQSVKFLV